VRVIPGWSAESERRFKEVLYRFLEEVHCTKAALYLLGEDGRYLLATQYGFGRRDLLAADHGAQAPLVILARQLRSRPGFYNRPEEIPELAGYLEGAGTARLLLTPLYGGSRLLGFVDARDKGRKLPFGSEDARLAGEIAASLVRLLSDELGYADLEPVEAPAPAPAAASRPVLAGLDTSAMRRWLTSARLVASLPEVTAVVATVAEGGATTTLVQGEAGLDGEEREAIRRHHAALLRGAGAPVAEDGAWRLEAGPPRRAGAGVAVSAVLVREPGWTLAATVLGPLGSAVPRAALELLAEQAAALLEAVRARRRWRGLARKLLEPGERRYPELVEHAAAVSRLAGRLAGAMGLPDDEVERAVVAGYLHDVGMRELDYERLYRHPAPGATERRLYRRHPAIGAAILEEAGLADLAEVVRHHHERWDGTGYPARLSGEAIPLLARVVHVAEVFDVLTSPGSYRRPLPRDEALGLLRSGAGHQFDPEAVRAVERVV